MPTGLKLSDNRHKKTERTSVRPIFLELQLSEMDNSGKEKAMKKIALLFLFFCICGCAAPASNLLSHKDFNHPMKDIYEFQQDAYNCELAVMAIRMRETDQPDFLDTIQFIHTAKGQAEIQRCLEIKYGWKKIQLDRIGHRNAEDFTREIQFDLIDRR